MSWAMCSPTWSVARERMWSRSGTIVRIFSSRVEVCSPPSRSASKIGVEPGGLGPLGLLVGATTSTSGSVAFSFPLRLRGRDIWSSGSEPLTVAVVGGAAVETVAPVAPGGSAVGLKLPRAIFFRIFLGPVGATAKLLSKTIPAKRKRVDVGSLKISGGVGLRAPKDRIFIRLGGDLDHGFTEGFGLLRGASPTSLDEGGSEAEGRGEEVGVGRSGAEELGSAGGRGRGGGSVSGLGSDAKRVVREIGDSDWY
nr:hypothetical protein Iba_chr09dCG11270 [Ipomoea batatas]